jgi:hypothetical protein
MKRTKRSAKSPDEIFPVTFRSLVEVRGLELEGEIPAFLHFAAWDDKRLGELR